MPDDHQHDSSSQAHSHGPGGHHAPAKFDRAFAIGALLNTIFVIAEVLFGLAAHSLALLADAAHNLGDVLSLLLAWGASWLVRRAPTHKRTYGYGRASILASLANAFILLISVGAIVLEAIRRFAEPAPITSTTVMAVAGFGVLINGVTAWLFASGRKGDLNIKGAFLHMAADAGVSLGVVVAALLISATGWLWLDPLTSIAIALVIVVGTWGLLKDSVNLAMDAVPEGIDLHSVNAYLRGLPGVAAVHDLHIWGLSTTETALSAHLVQPGPEKSDDLLARAADELRKRFGIVHATFQLEAGDGAGRPCETIACDVERSVEPDCPTEAPRSHKHDEHRSSRG